MKMEHRVQAAGPGAVAALCVVAGQQVSNGERLLVLQSILTEGE
jgi:biotin carboxyl carrier protein